LLATQIKLKKNCFVFNPPIVKRLQLNSTRADSCRVHFALARINRSFVSVVGVN